MDIKDELLKIAATIDHTYLKDNINPLIVKSIFAETFQYKFRTACVPQNQYFNLQEELIGKIDICTVMNFPFPKNNLESAIRECQVFLDLGLDDVSDLDIVIPYQLILENDFSKLYSVVERMVSPFKGKSLIVKLILETGLLSNDQLITTIETLNPFPFHFYKTSTGFSKIGATIEAVETIMKYKSKDKKIKASGGIKSFDDYRQYIEVGADVIGTSNGILILNQANEILS